MPNQRIECALLCGCLSLLTGCAVFQPPQVYPQDWDFIDTRDASTAHSGNEDDMRRQPRDLDESIERTHKLIRQYFRKAAEADTVPQSVGAALTGLAAYGGYRAVANPSAKTSAALLGSGGALYTAGSGINWNERAAAYNMAADGLNCLLEAALPYKIHGWALNRSDSGQLQLQATHQALQHAVIKLETLLIADANLTQDLKISDSRTVLPRCAVKEWDSKLCAPLNGVEDTRFQKDCRALEAQYRKACSASTQAAIYSAPAPEVSTAFSRADSIRIEARKLLAKSAQMQSASNDAGKKLWTSSLSVMNRAYAEVRRTGFNLPEMMKQFSAAFQIDKAKPPSAPAQGATVTVPVGAQRVTRRIDETTRAAITELNAAADAVTMAIVSMQDILDMNIGKPDFSPAKFDACTSEEAKVAQTAALAASARLGSAPSTREELVPVDDQVLSKLKLSKGASPADIESRIRMCQGLINATQDGRLTGTMRNRILGDECKGLP